MPFDLANLYSAFIVTCERVLREAGGVTSIIRIVDLHELSGPIPPGGIVIHIEALTVMKSRVRTEDHAFSMELVFPNGVTRTVQAIEGDKPLRVAFGSKAPESNPIFGAQVLIQINLNATLPGLYILRAMLDGQKIAETAITLRVRQTS